MEGIGIHAKRAYGRQGGGVETQMGWTTDICGWPSALIPHKDYRGRTSGMLDEHGDCGVISLAGLGLA